MGKLETLTFAEEVEGVLAHRVAAAERQDADLFGGPRPDLTTSPVTHHPFRIEPLGPRDDLAQTNRSAARSIDLVSVVNFYDLRIETRTEELRRARR